MHIAILFHTRYLHAKKDAYTRRNRSNSSILQGEWSLICKHLVNVVLIWQRCPSLKIKVSIKYSIPLQTRDTLIWILKYPWIHPRFYRLFWRNKPRMPYFLWTGVRGLKRVFSSLFNLFREKIYCFFASKTVSIHRVNNILLYIHL